MRKTHPQPGDLLHPDGVVDAGLAGPDELHPGDRHLQPRPHLLPLVPPGHKWVTIMIEMMILY